MKILWEVYSVFVDFRRTVKRSMNAISMLNFRADVFEALIMCFSYFIFSRFGLNFGLITLVILLITDIIARLLMDLFKYVLIKIKVYGFI